MEANKTDELIKEYESNKGKCDAFGNKMEVLLKEILQHNNLQYHSITYRLKDAESLKNKIISKNNKYNSLDEITDIVGIRIITYYDDEVDSIVSLLEREFEIDEENTIDKRKTLDPDKFGYRSVHYIVQLNNSRVGLPEYSEYAMLKAEVQVRSILQHAWAEIEHDSGYKSKDDIPRSIQRDFFRLAGLLELADKEFRGIRENLKEYKKKVEQEIDKQDANLLIDNISLSAFIRNNKKVAALNQEIKAINSFELEPSDYDSLYSSVAELKYVGFKTINELKEELEKYYDLALFMAKVRLRGKTYDTLQDTIGLFYLCYARLVRQNSPEKIVDYWENNNFNDNEGTEEMLIRAQGYLALYQDYKKQLSEISCALAEI